MKYLINRLFIFYYRKELLELSTWAFERDDKLLKYCHTVRDGLNKGVAMGVYHVMEKLELYPEDT